MATKFFKIVLNPQEHGLRLPKEFVKRYEQNLPGKVTMKAPNGPIIEVGLVKMNGETWLNKGWHKFKEYYSIGVGHLLVFEFNGKSHFNVVIFDTTTMEIEYPPYNDDEAINLNTASIRVPKTEDSVVFMDEMLTRKHEIEREQCARTKCSRRKRLRGVVNERCIAYKEAVAFKSDNHKKNVLHISVMHPSFVTDKYALNLPLKFAEEYLPEKFNILTLRALDGKTWSVRCNISTRNAKITTGWKKFVEDNSLKVGDVCVFEVIKSGMLTWNVIIFQS